MKLLFLVFSSLLIISIFSVKIRRSHKRSHFSSSSFINQEWKSHFDTIISEKGVKKITSKLFCDENTQWDNYFDLIWSPQASMPSGLFPPDTCKFLWLYTLQENQVKSYINNCLRKKKLSIDSDGKVKNPKNLPLDHVIKFIEGLRKEVLFQGSECLADKSGFEQNLGDLELICCDGHHLQSDFEGKRFLLTKAFISASRKDSCQSSPPTIIHLTIIGQNKNIIGRDIERFSAHRNEEEFLILPGSCFKKLPRKLGAGNNEFFYKNVSTEDCDHSN